MSDTYYAGTSNIVLPVANKSLFPPEYQEGSRLNYYSSLFNSVEINSSFYKLPLARTVIRWAKETPDHFRFTFKVWQEISHARNLDFKAEDLHKFSEIVNACQKKGCLLLQFPPKQAINLYQLERLLAGLSNDGWQLAVELRHSSWYRESVYTLLDNYFAGMVIHDLHSSATTLLTTRADFVYLRFHGPERGYRGSYSDAFLTEYATYIEEWQQEGKTVYVYFNNTLGAAVQNLLTLNKFVGKH